MAKGNGWCSPKLGGDSPASATYSESVAEPDDLLDDVSAAENRRDARRAAIITIIVLATVILASLALVIVALTS
jgi:hypothetical protein